MTPWKSSWRLRHSLRARVIVTAVTTVAFAVTGIVPSAMASSVPRKDILVIGQFRPPTGDIGNVYITASDAFVSDGIEELVSEPLFYENYETGKDMPWLGTSFAYSDGYTKLTIQLRHDAYWNDGVPFTSADVVYTMDQIIGDKTTPWRAGNIQANVASIKALGKYAVQLTLKAPNPRFIYTDMSAYVYTSNFTPLPAHIFKGNNFNTFSDFNLSKGWPVFTGPYRVSSVGPNSVTLTRNNNWWAVKAGLAKLPAPKEVIYTNPGSEDSAVSGLESNQYDYVGEGGITTAGYVTAQQHNSKLQNWNGELGYTDPCPFALTINTTQAPWDNAQMRWALSYAINKTQFTALLNSPGPSTPAATPFPTYPALNKLLKANSSLLKQYPTDLYSLSDEAKILTAQGYKLEGGKWIGPDGQPLSINISIFSPSILGDIWSSASQLLQQQLAAAGITATMSPGDWNVLIAAQGSNGKPTFDAQTWFECGSVTDPWATLNLFSNSPSSANPPHWTDQAYDQAVAAMGRVKPGSPKIEPLFRTALEQYLQQLPVIPLSERPDNIVTNTTYWTGWPTAANPYIQPPPWCMFFEQVVLHLKPAQ
jgi:peptide/nickel transport system substrate-binding protein